MGKIKKRYIEFGEIGETELADGIVQLDDDITQNIFINELRMESDRSAVIIAASYLDKLLEKRLLKFFVKGNSDARNKLFDMNGPFSSSFSKIEALFCLGDIHLSARNDLHVLRKLRNHCAHKWNAFKLNKFVEKEFISKLKNHLPLYRVPHKFNDYDCRSKFMMGCAFYIMTLNLIDERKP
jgi:hypothetical protein